MQQVIQPRTEVGAKVILPSTVVSELSANECPRRREISSSPLLSLVVVGSSVTVNQVSGALARETSSASAAVLLLLHFAAAAESGFEERRDSPDYRFRRFLRRSSFALDIEIPVQIRQEEEETAAAEAVHARAPW